MAKKSAEISSLNTTAPAAKKPRASRAKKLEAAVTVHHAETIEADEIDSSIEGLMASLDALNGPSDEVVIDKIATSTPIALFSPELAPPAAALIASAPTDLSDVVDADILEAAVGSADAVSASIAAATPEGIEAGAAPTGDACDIVEETAPVAAAAKKVPVPRKHYTDKTERLKDKLGAGLGEYSVLTLADAGVSDDDLKLKLEETMGIIRSMNKKKQNRAVWLIEFLAGKKATLNEVMARTAKILQRDGFITTGTDGNLFKELTSRPYSPAAARAMGGNTVGMMVDLKLLSADAKGKFVANPESLLLMKLQSMLVKPAAPEAVA